jgi:hypothetical protein
VRSDAIAAQGMAKLRQELRQWVHAFQFPQRDRRLQLNFPIFIFIFQHG